MGNFVVSVIKFFFALALFPVTYASAVSFGHHLKTYPGAYQDFFIWGLLIFLVIFLFLYQFWGFYEFGQSAMNGIFKFIAPVNQVIARVFPFFMLLTLLVFYCVTTFGRTNRFDHYFMFFTGFTGAMHILLTAQDRQNQEQSPIKPNYLFLINLVAIVNISLLVLILDVILGKFTFNIFFGKVILILQFIYVTASQAII